MSHLNFASDLVVGLDPVRFARVAGIEPDDWQARLLRSTAPRILLNVTRQGGKSSTVGLLACHTVLYEPGALVLVLSPSERQSKELFRRILATYRMLGRPVPGTAENALSLELENGSRVVALPGKEGTIRGYSGVRLLIIDEAAKVADDLYRAVRPMLAVSGGRLAVLSTPFGRRGFFYDCYQDRANWEYYEVPATACPRIPAAFLAEEQRAMGALWYASEYLCEFVENINSVFTYADVMGAFTSDVAPLFAPAESVAAAVGPITPAVRPLFALEAPPAEEFRL